MWAWIARREPLVRTESVKKALRATLGDDGRLSLTDVHTIIYSTNDSDSITDVEVKDVRIILDHARTIDPQGRHLIQKFLANPKAFLRYRGFSEQDLTA